jgi:hypothetical protein
MARDFEDMHDIDDLSDTELTALVREQLGEHGGLDVDDITVRSEDGVVHLTGRVGTDAELRMAEHVVTDVLGISDVANELVVDPIRRAESPMDIDEHLAEQERTEGVLLGDRPDQQSPEAQTTVEHLDQELYGTRDVGLSIEEGVPYVPPESPTPEGLEGSDIRPGSRGEDH